MAIFATFGNLILCCCLDKRNSNTTKKEIITGHTKNFVKEQLLSRISI
jgi:hypothetical protein